MKDIKDFDRRGWKTGFSRYRFAVPHWAHGEGRAIYNDVDQIYLVDPGQLFDLDMKGRAWLTITQRETSVMLLDCAKLSPLWRLSDAHRKKKKHFRALGAELWGELDPAWNARDGEFVPGESKLLHYSTLHTQPWRPFPGQLRYRHHDHAERWLALERSADEAGFEVFSRKNPSSCFAAAAPDLDLRKDASWVRGTLESALREARAESVLSVGPAGRPAVEFKTVNTSVATATIEDVRRPPRNAPFKHDVVIAADTLGYLPDEDIPWVLTELFARSRCLVFVAATCVRTAGSNSMKSQPSWWEQICARASARFPRVRWVLACRSRSWLGAQTLTRTGPIDKKVRS